MACSDQPTDREAGAAIFHTKHGARIEIAPTITIDTREQLPWKFENLQTKPGTLDTGDYSIRGLEHLVAVERKSLDDLLACVGRERARFRRELQRLRAYRFRLLIIEADAATPWTGDWRSALKPAHVIGSLAAWTCQFGLPTWLAGDADKAAVFAERYLYQAARTVVLEAEAVGAVENVAV